MDIHVDDAARHFERRGDDGNSRDTNGSAPDLTPAQIRVMLGVRSGLLNRQIAEDLGITEATVKAHMTALMRKLNVRNRTQVAIVAQALADPLHAGRR